MIVSSSSSSNGSGQWAVVLAVVVCSRPIVCKLYLYMVVTRSCKAISKNPTSSCHVCIQCLNSVQPFSDGPTLGIKPLKAGTVCAAMIRAAKDIAQRVPVQLAAPRS